MSTVIATELSRLLIDGGRVVVNPGDTLPFLTEWRHRGKGHAACVVLPRSIAEVQAIVRYCALNELSITPQGGNTGLSGGAWPQSQFTVLLNLREFRRIRSISREGAYVVADAGATLHEINVHSREVDLFLPIDIGSRESATVGGVVATNAGGMNVLRYGTTREQVLGLEVVLADGELWDGLRANRKDNSGPDLKQLFIGTEGTLGIVTGVCMRLVPLETHTATVLREAPSMNEVLALLRLARQLGSERLSNFELMSGFAVREATKRVLGIEPPLGATGDWYVLARFAGTDSVSNLAHVLAEQAFEAGFAKDGTLPRSLSEEERLWRIRDSFSELHRHLGPSHRFDIAVPVDHLGTLITDLEAVVKAQVSQCDLLFFGHIGDGNLHFSICAHEYALPGEREGIDVRGIVHDVVWSLGGTVSAEHGIGRFHVAELGMQKSPLERDLQAKMKRILDPKSLLNPGVIFATAPPPPKSKPSPR